VKIEIYQLALKYTLPESIQNSGFVGFGDVFGNAR